MENFDRRIDHLILSSTLDFSSDYIALEMQSRGLNYFRLNRDQFEDYDIEYNVDLQKMVIWSPDIGRVVVDKSPKSVYF